MNVRQLGWDPLVGVRQIKQFAQVSQHCTYQAVGTVVPAVVLRIRISLIRILAEDFSDRELLVVYHKMDLKPYQFM